MDAQRLYRFRIDAFTPATLPMARLAEYMADLAALLGEPEHVHFHGIEDGSAVLVQAIDEPAVRKVDARLKAARDGDGPADVLRAFASLDRRLAQDNAVGTLSDGDGAEAVRFPGRDRPRSLAYASFRQQGCLEGVLVRIGGRDRSVHALLQDGEQTWRCETTREMARDLRGHLFEGPIRVYGQGRWRRSPQGNWTLERFTISSFEALDDAAWPETVARLRAIGGKGWHAAHDPLAELVGLRDPEDGAG